MPSKPARYTSDFRADAVKLCLRGDRPLTHVARDLGINHWTLREWYTKAKMTRPKPPKQVAETPPAGETDKETIARLERDLKKLQRENDSLRQDREILKKAAAFFAKESE